MPASTSPFPRAAFERHGKCALLLFRFTSSIKNINVNTLLLRRRRRTRTRRIIIIIIIITTTITTTTTTRIRTRTTTTDTTATTKTSTTTTRQAFQDESGKTWNDLRRGLEDLKKEASKLDTFELSAGEQSIDDVWEFILSLMHNSPKYAKQIMDAVSTLLASKRWADGLLRATGRSRLSLWKLSAAAGGTGCSPVELAALLLKLGIEVDELLPASALESGTDFVEELAGQLAGEPDLLAALRQSELGAAWRRAQEAAAAMRSTEGVLLDHRVSDGDLGTLAEANQAQAASIEAAGRRDRRPVGCRKDVVDNLLDLTEEALGIASRCLSPMMSGYAGEMNVAMSAKSRVQEFRQRQADLQAQLVVLGPCQVGKTSLTYSLVGFAALPPTTPSMVTTRWVHTPTLTVPRLTMPEALAKLLSSWTERAELRDLAASIPEPCIQGRAVEGIDVVADALASIQQLVHRGRSLGAIRRQELEALSRPSMCISVEVAFSALASLEEALTDTGTLSILDLPSPDGNLLWEEQDVQLLFRRSLQEADGVLVVVDASKYEVPRWMGDLLREAFIQERLLRREDAWIVANRIDQLPDFFCKDGVSSLCQRVKDRQFRDYQDVILDQDHVIPTAAHLSLLAMYGHRKVAGTGASLVPDGLDCELWFAQICSFLFGVHWSSQVKDLERPKWRQSMRELQLLGQVTGNLAKNVLKTAYVKMLPRSVARVMFDLSQLIGSFVSSLKALEGGAVTIDALISGKAVSRCCDEASRAHQKWQRSLDYYLTEGGVDAATKQKVLLDSRNLKLVTEGAKLARPGLWSIAHYFLNDTEEETADEDSERDYDEEDEDPECKAQARRAGGKKSARFFAPGTRSLTALKWAFPAFVNGSCLFASMWLLHIATFYYVKLMDREELAYVVNSNYTAGQASYALSPGLRPNDLSYGSLQDPLEATLGFKAVPLKVLDMVSATFPFIWFLLVLKIGDLQNWTKVLLCNAMLGLGKGIFGALTIIPDSIGWQQCKARLGEANLEFLRHEVPDPSTHGLLSTASKLLLTEFVGPHENRLGSGMRFCADMMYSGHTYFTTLYILAILELARQEMRRNNWKHRKYFMALIYVVCVVEQSTECFLVILNRFHYTIDVLMAIIMVFLVYTSAPVVIAAKLWRRWRVCILDHKGPEGDDQGLQAAELQAMKKKAQEMNMVVIPAATLRSALRDEGDIVVEPCCVPFCCLAGRHHILSHEHFRELHQELPAEHHHHHHHEPQLASTTTTTTKKQQQRQQHHEP
ncbi:unnamed protein product [Polarella glacialis]|uniref:Sphingomyelin synthase-like domain-containing protein n=1 Tax=Polarella glacialis TaxID=89957 RepID=A0A813H2U9_POLGL|nr:unnamed protein product [Polarella glacialis]